MKIKDYRGNELDIILAYGIRNQEKYDFIAPSHHALKEYTKYTNPTVTDDAQLDDLYHETLRHAVLFNLDD